MCGDVVVDSVGVVDGVCADGGVRVIAVGCDDVGGVGVVDVVGVVVVVSYFVYGYVCCLCVLLCYSNKVCVYVIQ